MINLGQEDFIIKKNSKIAQMVINKVEQADIIEVNTKNRYVILKSNISTIHVRSFGMIHVKLAK